MFRSIARLVFDWFARSLLLVSKSKGGGYRAHAAPEVIANVSESKNGLSQSDGSCWVLPIQSQVWPMGVFIVVANQCGVQHIHVMSCPFRLYHLNMQQTFFFNMAYGWWMYEQVALVVIVKIPLDGFPSVHPSSVYSAFQTTKVMPKSSRSEWRCGGYLCVCFVWVRLLRGVWETSILSFVTPFPVFIGHFVSVFHEKSRQRNHDCKTRNCY